MTRWQTGLVIGWLVLGVPLAGLAQSPVNRRHSETLLGPFPPEAYDSARISPDGRHLAYVASSENGLAVMLDGSRQPVYDGVDALEFSPNSRRLAYAARRGQAWYLVVDGREQGPYRRVGPPVFSSDSEHLACVVLLEDDRRAVIVDGQAGSPCDLVFEGELVFSPDSRRLAYGIQRQGQWWVVEVPVPEAVSSPGSEPADGGPSELPSADETTPREYGPYDFIGSATGIQFSPDGARLAFAGLLSGKWSVVLNGKTEATFDNLGSLAFSPNGQRLAYAAQSAGKWQLVVDGKPQKAYSSIADESITWSPNSVRLAYVAQAGKTWLLIVDGKEGKPYDDIGEIKFSRDGRSLAYAAKSGAAEMVVLNGQEERPFDRIGSGTLEFSPGGKLAYIANTGDVSFAVVDGKRKPRYDLVGYLTFTPDGSRTVYIAVSGDEAFTVVDDQQAAHRYEGVWNVRGRKLLFDTRRRFHYMAVKDGNMYLVEEEIE